MLKKKSTPVLSMAVFTGEKEMGNEASEKLQALVDACLIDVSEEIERPPVAMFIEDLIEPIPLFSKGNFSIITGAAKSRKTFLISMFMAASIKKNGFQQKLYCPNDGINIIFDTEQSRYKAQQIAKRICYLSEIENPSNLLVYSLRTLEPRERIALIDRVLSTTPNINFVAIDGIIDLDIDPILQADQAQNIVMKLMQWTEYYKIHITCVLHYNKAVSTLLGHLGSFSHRKADAIIEVAKDKIEENISIVRPVDYREKEFLPFAFSIDTQGMPFIMNDFLIEPKSNVKKTGKEKIFHFYPAQLDTTENNKILKSVFKDHQEQGYGVCWRNIKISVEKNIGFNIGDNKAKDMLACFINDGLVKKIEQKPNPVYVLPEYHNNYFG